MADRIKNKFIVVEVRSPSEGDADLRYRMDLERFRTSNDESDLELIIKGLCSKRPRFAPLFTHPKCSFAVQEPDNSLIEIGIKSPILDATVVVCTLPKEEIPPIINKTDSSRTSTMTSLDLTASALRNVLDSAAWAVMGCENLTLSDSFDELRTSTPVRNSNILFNSVVNGTGVEHSTVNQSCKEGSSEYGKLLIHEGNFEQVITPDLPVEEKEIVRLCGTDLPKQVQGLNSGKNEQPVTSQTNVGLNFPMVQVLRSSTSERLGDSAVLQFSKMPVTCQLLGASSSKQQVSSSALGKATAQGTTVVAKTTVADGSCNESSSFGKRANGRRVISPAERAFEKALFKLPKQYREDIDRDLSLGAKLEAVQENFICRAIVHKISKQTLAPYMADLRWVAEQLIEKHNCLIFENDISATTEAWAHKLSLCIARQRSEQKLVITDNGRPAKKSKLVTLLTSPTALVTTPDMDEVSYWENTKKLNEIYQRSPDAKNELILLQDLTYSARRIYFTKKGMISDEFGVEDIIKQHGLILFNQFYLVREFEKIMAVNIADFLKEKWAEIVIKIISLGKCSKAKAVRELFGRKIEKDLLCLALLPVLIGSDINNSGRKVKKTCNNSAIDHSKYFFHHLTDNETLDQRKPKPYIAYYNNEIVVVVETKPLFKARSSEEAILILMAVYYVFHLEYESACLPTLWFIQKYLLKSSSVEIDKSHRVKCFVSKLEKVNPIISSDDSE